ncbi:large conductance mechanosensitive channel [Sphingobium sp. B2D3A]|uniref:large conductance mechanosensitive channel protein MscL n=1 Tax=Sphingobium TaxID=165695 RepID=UPI0015EBEBF3|nr:MULTISPECIES: large conductance mechanosensitive channel protein MscL [Sphingobium]MCW2338760.1 large conductance mechanosensitive channel [Sphingobium sp. B2D3A]MCW2364424.1 large conductance mechanosensitive channel [Sphingobium sp. B10D3B]MCW2367069.1 large conductance mechanosensitive channel [Sphingobium sp. B7D2B]MCW2385218.1 large conductance mechanosensitive channel [Sphingobium sp. B2D3D]MCW2393879.1 large conductance mechanosensitive channel [Sphingobium sp. B8D3B]
MLTEFKAFIARGNVLDLAVGVIIGAAFGAIVSSVTDDLIMPVIGALLGGLDFSNYFVPLAAVPAGTEPTLEAMKAAAVPVFAYGSFITAVIKFFILAFVIFLIVRQANRFFVKKKAEEVAAPAGPSEVDLLKEIRDVLKAKP